jgi:hypothetical protein
MGISVRLGIQPLNGIKMQKTNTDEVLPNEDNLLMTTWSWDECLPQKEGEEKVAFYINESILAQGEIAEHFSKAYKNILKKRDIQYMCIKGKHSKVNQDNMFVLVDNDVKIFGMFAGHGIHGHRVSSFACGKMLEYIRNKSDDFFRK